MIRNIPDDLITMKYAPGIYRQNGNSLFSVSRYGGSNKEAYSRYVSYMRNITDVLKEFGIHISNNGYSYIIDAVMLIIDQRSMDIKLNNDVYPYVADKYEFSKTSTVEHNIRNAIRSACLDNERTPGINKMSIFGNKPKNKQFLMYVAEVVSRRMYDEIMSVAG